MPRPLTTTLAIAVLAASAVASSGVAAASDAAAPTQQGCATPWVEYGSFLQDSESPLFAAPPGIDFSRQVQFRAFGGVYASRTNESCQQEKAKFGAASEVRQLQCGNFQSCSYTEWSDYVQEDTPKTEFRFPDQNAAWDELSDSFQTWPVPGPPPP